MHTNRTTPDTVDALSDHIDDLMLGADLGWHWLIETSRQLRDDNVYVFEATAHIARPIAHPRLMIGQFHQSRLAMVHGTTRVETLVKLADLLADVIATGKAA